MSEELTHPELSDFYHVQTDEFDPAAFQHKLTTKYLGRCFIYRKEVSSTMEIIQREALEGAPTGTLVFASHQTRGRGRMARPWASAPGNLAFSLLLRPKTAAELPKLNFAAAVAVATTAHDYGIAARVKWPNDVWIGDKKAAGVLLDANLMGQDIQACIGIGVNVNSDMTTHHDDEVRQVATSFFTALKKTLPLESVLASICNHLEELLPRPMDYVLARYKAYDMLIGQEVLVMPKKREHPLRVEATAIGFTNEGYLQVKIKSTGELETLSSEEVTIRPSSKI